MVNATITLLQLLVIIYDCGALNPYTYQGMHQKYFINTGDRLRGITFDGATTNALLNTLGIIYFLSKRKMLLVLICTLTLLATGSNLTNLLLLIVLTGLFLFKSSRNQKSIIIICFFLIVIFFARISPQNKQYVTEVYERFFDKKISSQTSNNANVPIKQRPDSLLTLDEKKQKIAELYLDSLRIVLASREKPNPSKNRDIMLSLPEANIHSELYQWSRDATSLQKQLLSFSKKNTIPLDTDLQHLKKMPGKIIAFRQTVDFFKSHPERIILGNGMGNFSSKLAFRASGLDVAGGYPKKIPYLNNAFKYNHLKLYLSYFSKNIDLHSLVNSPDSVYIQLAGEYGLAGLVAFFVLYAGFFFKKGHRHGYAVPALLLLLASFASGYWFEQLSIVVLFELMMLMNIKEGKKEFSYHE
jgi:hypothetical protein